MVKKPIFRSRPEAILQVKIITMLEARGWYVKSTHGSSFSRGWPDLYCFNLSFKGTEYGAHRWIDVKVPQRYQYTKAQCQEWPRWEAVGLGVWILMANTEEAYTKLFEPPNFREYWKPAYDKYLISVQEVMEEMDEIE